MILLTDQGLATRMEVIHKPDLSKVELWERLTAAGRDDDYKRYEITEDAVSPMGIPGEEGGQYVATGIEHDELGHPAYTPENHVAMQTKRWAKLDPLKNGVARHETVGDERPDIAVIGFGSTYGPASEAALTAISSCEASRSSSTECGGSMCRSCADWWRRLRWSVSRNTAGPASVS